MFIESVYVPLLRIFRHASYAMPLFGLGLSLAGSRVAAAALKEPSQRCAYTTAEQTATEICLQRPAHQKRKAHVQGLWKLLHERKDHIRGAVQNHGLLGVANVV